MIASGRTLPASLALLLVAAAPGMAGEVDLAVEPSDVAVGGVAVVRVSSPDVAGGSFGERPLRFFRSGDRSVALVGIDLDHSPGPVPLHVRLEGGRELRSTLRVVDREFPVERLTVPKTYTDLDAKALERVHREQRRLEALWSGSRPERLWEGAFVLPADGPAGSPFGLRRYFNGQPRSPHAGIDFKAPAGAPVSASNRGDVVLADDLFFTGNTVVLDHGLGLFTMYVHLSEIAVSPGRVVAKGEEIGKVGATGRVTGPHLHFATRIGEARVDPEALLGRVVE